MKNIIYTIAFLLAFGNAKAQVTVGLLELLPNHVSDGYNLFYPLSQSTVFLTDNCGKVVNTWSDSGLVPGSSVYLLEDGNLLKTSSQGFNNNCFSFVGGAGDFITLKDWENNTLWQYDSGNCEQRFHHDIEPLPNGNILILGWEKNDLTTCINLGRDFATMPAQNEIWTDYIIEVEPIFPDSANIVWEWHLRDHLIQDFDDTKLNFGVVSDNPGRVNFNETGGSNLVSWTNSNAIDYNPVLDQILFSAPSFGEIWIIDHSTTTAEAATSSGGSLGVGGNIAYRWGNPATYDAGTSDDAKLFFQHDPNWMNPNAQPGDEDFGKVLVFNNRVGVDFSSVNIIETLNPATQTYANDYPADFEFTFTADPPQEMYSNILSSARKLPNGNLLVCSGNQSTAWEIRPNGDIAWKYRSPAQANGNFAEQGDANANTNSLFRLERYAPDFPGFNGKDLTAGDFLETNPTDEICELFSNAKDISFSNIEIFPIPATENIFFKNLEENTAIVIFNLIGNEVLSFTASNSILKVNVEELPTGIYTVLINNEYSKKIVIQ